EDAGELGRIIGVAQVKMTVRAKEGRVGMTRGDREEPVVHASVYRTPYAGRMTAVTRRALILVIRDECVRRGHQSLRMLRRARAAEVLTTRSIGMAGGARGPAMSALFDGKEHGVLQTGDRRGCPGRMARVTGGALVSVTGHANMLWIGRCLVVGMTGKAIEVL